MLFLCLSICLTVAVLSRTLSAPGSCSSFSAGLTVPGCCPAPGPGRRSAEQTAMHCCSGYASAERTAMRYFWLLLRSGLLCAVILSFPGERTAMHCYSGCFLCQGCCLTSDLLGFPYGMLHCGIPYVHRCGHCKSSLRIMFSVYSIFSYIMMISFRTSFPS